MRIGQAQDLPLQGWCRRASVGATLVVARCVENTAHGHLLDPFGGTGTTALLAAQMGYPATLVEINPFLVWLSRAKTRLYTPEATYRSTACLCL